MKVLHAQYIFIICLNSFFIIHIDGVALNIPRITNELPIRGSVNNQPNVYPKDGNNYGNNYGNRGTIDHRNDIPQRQKPNDNGYDSYPQNYNQRAARDGGFVKENVNTAIKNVKNAWDNNRPQSYGPPYRGVPDKSHGSQYQKQDYGHEKEGPAIIIEDDYGENNDDGLQYPYESHIGPVEEEQNRPYDDEDRSYPGYHQEQDLKKVHDYYNDDSKYGENDENEAYDQDSDNYDRKYLLTTVTPLEEVIQTIYSLKEGRPVDEFLLEASNTLHKTLDVVGQTAEWFIGLTPLFGDMLSRKFAEGYNKFKDITKHGAYKVRKTISQLLDGIDEKISSIAPDTQWCELRKKKGWNSAYSFAKADTCCEEHDRCRGVLFSGEDRFGLRNNGFFPRSPCWCDIKFRQCLKRVGTSVANNIAYTYFNNLKIQCFKDCTRYTRPGRCSREGKQWVNQPPFE